MKDSASRKARAAAYARRFEKVFDHIDRHLDEALSVENLSQVANFSKFHFHRQFSEYCGVGVGRYIQLMRLRRASYRLVFNPLDRVTDIALDAGFENPESFSRAFKQVFGQTPSQFRHQPEWASWSAQYQFPRRERMDPMDVKIVNTKPALIAALEHRGDPALLMGSVARFIEWRKASGLSPVPANATYGIAYDNPDTTPPADWRFDICSVVAAPVPANPQGVTTKQMPGGRCAVVRHIGTRDRIGESVYYLFRQWLPGSGEEPADFPVYFQYLDVEIEMPEHEQRTDVFLPLKGPA